MRMIKERFWLAFFLVMRYELTVTFALRAASGMTPKLDRTFCCIRRTSCIHPSLGSSFSALVLRYLPPVLAPIRERPPSQVRCQLVGLITQSSHHRCVLSERDACACGHRLMLNEIGRAVRGLTDAHGTKISLMDTALRCDALNVTSCDSTSCLLTPTWPIQRNFRASKPSRTSVDTINHKVRRGMLALVARRRRQLCDTSLPHSSLADGIQR